MISAVAALISQVNATLSLGSLQLLVYTALASGLVTPLSGTAEVAFFLVGAAWATLTTLVQTRTENLDPDRTAVADRLHPDRRPAHAPATPPRPSGPGASSPPPSTPPTTG